LKKKEIKKYPKWFYLFAFLIPILFVLIIELALVFLNYGNDYTTFIKISDKFENYKFFNPNLPQKYFGDLPIRPSVIADGFQKDKGKNTFRIFALGGSTTAGFPHPQNGSFPRLLKNKLQSQYPEINFEVINLGVSAINSITIRDIIDDVFPEDPDLIIIYAGHNEYYGALGPASNVTGFYNLFTTRLILELKEFKTVQLLGNFIGNIFSTFSGKSEPGKTLMSELAGKNLVPLNSEIYCDGVMQFENNLEYILNRCEEENVETIVGTLASNLMQAPLCRFTGCDSLYQEFQSVVNNPDEISKVRLIEIKDEDKLRFRAPEKFNQIIFSLSKEHNSNVLDFKKNLEDNSPKGIIGDNLMLDHLHPSFKGNELIAEQLQKSISSNKEILAKLNSIKSVAVINNPRVFRSYSPLDSLFSMLRIKYLKNDFPFVEKKNNLTFLPNSESIELKIANEILNGEISWESAHAKLAKYYLDNGNLNGYLEELNVLIDDKPFDNYFYLKAIKTLEEKNQIEYLKYFLKKYHNYFSDLLSAEKLGHIYFNERNHREALRFYNKCLSSTNNPKIFFNLSAIYFEQKNLKEAISNIQKCLKINPSYPNAQKIYDALLNIYRQQ
jgi:lysophospholipase L1-like esterase